MGAGEGRPGRCLCHVGLRAASLFLPKLHEDLNAQRCLSSRWHPLRLEPETVTAGIQGNLIADLSRVREEAMFLSKGRKMRQAQIVVGKQEVNEKNAFF